MNDNNRQNIERTFVTCIGTDLKLLGGGLQLSLSQKGRSRSFLRNEFKSTDLLANLISTTKTLSEFTTVFLLYKALKFCPRFSIIPYVIHIVNHLICLFKNEQKSIRNVQSKMIPLRR